MTVYEALVHAQSNECKESEGCNIVLAHCKKELYDKKEWIAKEQDHIDRAYLLGIAIDNLPADVASMEV